MTFRLVTNNRGLAQSGDVDGLRYLVDNADVLCLQEARAGTGAGWRLDVSMILNSFGTEWAVLQDLTDQGMSETAIAWRKDLFTPGAAGRDLLVEHGKRSITDHYITWVLLTEKVSGDNVVLASLQIPSSDFKSLWPAAKHGLQDWAAQHERFIAAGDWGMDLTGDPLQFARGVDGTIQSVGLDGFLYRGVGVAVTVPDSLSATLANSPRTPIRTNVTLTGRL